MMGRSSPPSRDKTAGLWAADNGGLLATDALDTVSVNALDPPITITLCPSTAVVDLPRGRKWNIFGSKL